mmetsp:Transcript_16829/g.45554  ORF Transcript_16829/g.45554 Transcript_16829/m.45554 type:complete len:215 (+) Transcript_16829:1120-1764(+)
MKRTVIGSGAEFEDAFVYRRQHDGAGLTLLVEFASSLSNLFSQLLLQDLHSLGGICFLVPLVRQGMHCVLELAHTAPLSIALSLELLSASLAPLALRTSQLLTTVHLLGSSQHFRTFARTLSFIVLRARLGRSTSGAVVNIGRETITLRRGGTPADGARAQRAFANGPRSLESSCSTGFRTIEPMTPGQRRGHICRCASNAVLSTRDTRRGTCR